MKRRKPAGAVRVVSRLVVAVFSLLVFSLVSIQFARIIKENVAMANSLSAIRHDVAVLRDRNRREQREIRRLTDPLGAIPEIHDRLHLVRPNEAIIYVKQAHPSPQ